MEHSLTCPHCKNQVTESVMTYTSSPRKMDCPECGKLMDIEEKPLLPLQHLTGGLPLHIPCQYCEGTGMVEVKIELIKGDKHPLIVDDVCGVCKGTGRV